MRCCLDLRATSVIRELAGANEQGGQSPLRVHSPTLIRTLHLARALE